MSKLVDQFRMTDDSGSERKEIVFNLGDLVAREMAQKALEKVKVVEYQYLLELLNHSKLEPGCLYRLTDYQAYTAQDGTIAENHRFDILLMATDVNRLAEEAFALHNENDTYFKKCNLSAWRIWYCLNGDSSRFSWVDNHAPDYRGVIYRMIDEFNNDLPYDFKNIKVHDMDGRSVYAFNTEVDGEDVDFTVYVNSIPEESMDVAIFPYKNKIKTSFENNHVRSIPIIVLRGFYDNIEEFYGPHNITIGANCNNIELKGSMFNVSIGDNCDNISFSESRRIVIGDNCRNLGFFNAYNVTFHVGASSCYCDPNITVHDSIFCSQSQIHITGTVADVRLFVLPGGHGTVDITQKNMQSGWLVATNSNGNTRLISWYDL